MNNFSFTGRLTRDSEFRSTSSGLSILKFTVANNTGFGDKKRVNYVNCTIFGKRAEGRLKDFLKKGQEVGVTGELNLNQFTKQDGQQSAALECVVNSVDLIGKKNESQDTVSTINSLNIDEIPF